MLGHSPAWFRTRRIGLEARGFPLPVDGCGHRWDSAAIERWLDRQTQPSHSRPPAAGDVDGWREHLERRLLA